MEKDADAFRTISEVGEDLDLPQHVLRFWETRFSQIKPIKRGGGRRYYRPDDIDLLRGIKHLLYAEGYTIKGVQRILREESPRFVQTIGREGRIPGTGEPQQTPRSAAVASPDIDVGFGALPENGLQDFDPLAMGQSRKRSSKLDPAFDVPDFPEKANEHLPERSLDLPEALLESHPAGQHQRSEASVDLADQPDHAVQSANLFPDEPASTLVEPPRKSKPKQLALFEGMGDEGLSAKDRDTLRQALERIDECRKILASADLVNSR